MGLYGHPVLFMWSVNSTEHQSAYNCSKFDAGIVEGLQLSSLSLCLTFTSPSNKLVEIGHFVSSWSVATADVSFM